MNSMFKECNILSSLDLCRFDASEIANMRYIFFGAEKSRKLL